MSPGDDVTLIADVVLRAGWHPYRGGGRALTMELVRRHHSQANRSLIPSVTSADVAVLADYFGIDRHFEETASIIQSQNHRDQESAYAAAGLPPREEQRALNQARQRSRAAADPAQGRALSREASALQAAIERRIQDTRPALRTSMVGL